MSQRAHRVWLQARQERRSRSHSLVSLSSRSGSLRVHVVRETQSLVISKIFDFRTTCGDWGRCGHSGESHRRVCKSSHRSRKPLPQGLSLTHNSIRCSKRRNPINATEIADIRHLAGHTELFRQSHSRSSIHPHCRDHHSNRSASRSVRSQIDFERV